MFGHDAAHRGRSAVVGAQAPTLNWASATRSFSGFDFLPDLEDFSPVIGTDGAVYFADGQGVVALNADGSLRWVYPLAHAASAVALGADGAIYAGHENGMLALNPDGTLRWDYAAGMPLRWPVVAPDGRIVASSLAVPHLRQSLGYGAVVVIDATGREVMRVKVPGGPTATPALAADAGVVVPARQCTRWRWFDQVLECVEYRALLYAAGPDERQPHVAFASVKGPSSRFASPSIGSDGAIYVAAIAGSQEVLYGLDPDGRPRWSRTLDCCDVSPPAIGPDGTVYVDTMGATGRRSCMPWRPTAHCVGGRPCRRASARCDGRLWGRMGRSMDRRWKELSTRWPLTGRFAGPGS